MGNQASTFNVNIPGWKRLDAGELNSSRYAYLTFIPEDPRRMVEPLDITIENPFFGPYIMTIKQGTSTTTVRGDLNTFGPFLRERYGRQLESAQGLNTTSTENLPMGPRTQQVVYQ